jgi:hypothetical protein
MQLFHLEVDQVEHGYSAIQHPHLKFRHFANVRYFTKSPSIFVFPRWRIIQLSVLFAAKIIQ